MDDSKIFIVGAKGQLGTALRQKYPGSKFADIDEMDITEKDSVINYDWSGIECILNAAAYTNVDGAETPEGKKIAWQVNDEAVENLAQVARDKNLILVHIGTDYDFDGTKKGAYKEDDPTSPLGVYAKSKVAGSERAAKVPKHYIVRTAWVIGEGKNFVRTMLDLGQKGVEPTVVADQIGRPTFTTELAKAIKFLIDNQATFGTYNVTNEGSPVSWADFTREIFSEAGYELRITDTTTKEYFASKPGVARRPLNSVLDLSKIKAAGFEPRDWHENLREYIRKEVSK